MFLRLLFESIRRGARRKLVAVVAVALGVAGSTALLAVLLASGDRLATELGSYGANLRVLPEEGRQTFDAAELAAVRKTFWHHNVVALAPTLELRVLLARPDAGAAVPGGTVVLTGTWFDVAFPDGWRTGLPAVRPTLEVEGRWPADGADEVVLGRRLAAGLAAGAPAGASELLGETVAASLAGRSRELRVVGIVAGGGEEEERAFAPLAAVHALAGRAPAGTAARAHETHAAAPGPDRQDHDGQAAAAPAALPGGPVTAAEVFAMTTPEPRGLRPPETMSPEEYDRWYCTAYPSSVAHQIDEAMPGARAEVVLGITRATRELLGRLRGVLLAAAAVALAAAVLGVTAVMTATVLERRREAGLLLALGAEGWKVAGFFVAESALLGLAGGLAGGAAGLAAGAVLGRAVLDAAVSPSPVLVPLAAAAGVAIAVSGGLPPVLRLFRQRPALALRKATA